MFLHELIVSILYHVALIYSSFPHYYVDNFFTHKKSDCSEQPDR
nr:MAG TPA: hypothetical protein [Caudoviricetes sp.]